MLKLRLSKKTAQLAKKINNFSLLLLGLLWMITLNLSYLKNFFGSGLPAGMDASGHFVLSQLYYDSHWPALDGRIESFFQGFSFPRFYPPFFYWLTGSLFYLWPDIPKEVLFKITIILPCLLMPGLLAMLYRTISPNQGGAFGVLFISSLLLTSDDEISRYMVGLKEGVETGLCTQSLSVNILLILLITIFSKIPLAAKVLLISFISAALLLSNMHVVIFTLIFISIFLILTYCLYHKINWVLIGTFVFGLILSLPWYLNVLKYRSETPTVSIENFDISQELFGYILLSIIANLFILVFKREIDSLLSAFCCAAFLTLPLFCVSLEPLAVRLPWQPHRLLALHNLFLPIYLVYAYQVFLRFCENQEDWIQKRVRLGSLIILSLFCMTYRPLEMKIAALSTGESGAIADMNDWLKRHPAKGFYLIPFTSNSGWLSPFDIAVSHYIALAGERSLWAVFRESSFNSILATCLRNMFSSRVENWGIPNSLDLEKIEKIDPQLKFELLSKFGVERLIVRNENLSEVVSLPGFTKIIYQNDFLTVIQLIKEPVLSEAFDKVILFVSSGVNNYYEKNLDFATLAQSIAVEAVQAEPVLIFKSCDEIKSKIQNSENLKIACGYSEKCCSQRVADLKELRNPVLLNNLKIRVDNLTPADSLDLVAAPWRRAELLE